VLVLLELVVLVGLKDAETPFGRVATEKATLPVNPFRAVTVMVLVPLAPCITVTVLGEAESEKVGTGAIVSATLAVLVNAPDVPVTVTVKLPSAAVALALKVRVLVVDVLAGLKEAMTPAGRVDVVDSNTVPLNPFWEFTVTVVDPVTPCIIVTAGIESEKLGAGATVSDTDVV
jgi:hypothetical protein